MDVLAPPEVTSALIYSGPGASSLIEASGAWQQLAVELENSVAGYASALSSLIESWDGPSAAAMVAAVEPYLVWLRSTAQQAQQMATSAEAAAGAFTTVRSAVVPPPVVTANRTRLAQLLATNRFGTNTAAIAQTEVQYQEMWANNSAALSSYQTASAQSTNLPQFSSPLAISDPTATANQASVIPQTAGVSSSALSFAPLTSGSSLLGATAFDPNGGWFGLANTWGNQFISSGFPINLLQYLAQSSSAQALQGVNGEVGTGLAEGMAALPSGIGGLGALGSGLGLAEGATTTAAVGVGVSVGKLTAPPAVVGLLPATQVQLASAASPLPAGESGLSPMPMMPPIMPPPVTAGSGWRKRKQPKYEDAALGAEFKGKVMPRSPSAG